VRVRSPGLSENEAKAARLLGVANEISRKGKCQMLKAVCLLGALACFAVTATASATQSQDADMLAVATAFNDAREICYSASECPIVDELMSLFTADARRTEIARNNNVVQLQSPDELRADHVRVASSFTGRRVETTSMEIQGRNVVMFQLNWNPGATEPDPFVSVLRIEESKIAHWVLIAP